MPKDLNYTLSLKDLFSKRMQGAVDMTKKLDSEAKKATQSYSDLRKAVEKIQKIKENQRVDSLVKRKLGTGSGGVGTSAIGGLANMLTAGLSVASVKNFGSAVIDSLKNYEYFHASLKTMLQGNTLAANSLEKQLVNLAKTTPFQLTEVQDATKQLLAYGFRAGDVVDTMKMLGDVSSGIGAPLNDIAYLYGTLKTSGKVMQVDLRQFAGRGIPIYETLAKRLGVTTTKINELVHDGKIGFKDIEGAFKDMTQAGGQFFNLMDDQSKTVGGRISNLADVWEQIKVKIGNSQKGIISGTIDFITKFASEIDAALGIQNQMESQFSKAGIKGYSALEKAAAGTFGTVDDLTLYQISLNKVTDATISNQQKLNILTKAWADVEGQRMAGLISNSKAAQKLALIQGNIDTVRGDVSVKSQTSKKVSDIEDKNEAKSKALANSNLSSSGVNITAQRPQSLVINITKLVENLNLTSQNLKEGTGKIREEVSKIFLEMVNDANLVLTK